MCISGEENTPPALLLLLSVCSTDTSARECVKPRFYTLLLQVGFLRMSALTQKGIKIFPNKIFPVTETLKGS